MGLGGGPDCPREVANQGVSPGSALCSETSAQPPGPAQGEPARSPQTRGPPEEVGAPGEQPRPRTGPQPSQQGLRAPAAPSSWLSPSSSGASSAGTLATQASQCSLAKSCRQPPVVLLPKLVYDMVTATDSSGLPKAASLLPAPSVMWASSFRPLLNKTMTSTEQSLYYRQWTVPRPSHMDYGNRAEGHVDGFHPRRLLLSGPPQVSMGHTGPRAVAQARVVSEVTAEAG